MPADYVRAAMLRTARNLWRKYGLEVFYMGANHL